MLVIGAGDLWRGGGDSDNVQEEDMQKVSKRLLQKMPVWRYGRWDLKTQRPPSRNGSADGV